MQLVETIQITFEHNYPDTSAYWTRFVFLVQGWLIDADCTCIIPNFSCMLRFGIDIRRYVRIKSYHRSFLLSFVNVTFIKIL